METEYPVQPTFLKQHGAVLLAPVRVFPRSNRNELTIATDGLQVRLTAPPVDGAANEALVALVAERLKLPRRAVRVVRGAASRQKIIEMTGLSAEEFWKRLPPNAGE